MFDKDNWNEIFSAIRKNKLRTFLTGFAISWGIFMFCILLAAGNGLRNGMLSGFEGQSVNSLQYRGWWSSKPYQGLPVNRSIDLDERDMDMVSRQVPEAGIMSPRIDQHLSAHFGTRHTECSVSGVLPEYQNINKIKIKEGHFVNSMDNRQKRKVAVINDRLNEVLFDKQQAIGKIFYLNNIGYTVVGVSEEANNWGNEATAYIPFATAHLLYNRKNVERVIFTLNDLDTKAKNDTFETRFREKVAAIHHFDPKDDRAISVWNRLQMYLQFVGIFNGISLFIWIIGIGTLIAGIIGISNIMLITVRERTREIGIRKALGAKPASILGSILLESMVITSIFGYIGMFLGVGFGELAASILSSDAIPKEAAYMIQNPTIDVSVALGAMVVLIISGLIAGYFPAWRAVKISPVEAMRAE
ncbi:MAG: ABC transporter permease [Dysgonamonadaceae bacterium]|jgi:putative ABC transport system permease protein|nr:ABC transporter permease [Dysgonamonadaceae bacterium]